ncbi:hypothetical protein HN51_034392 [Arachis hypogaea]
MLHYVAALQGCYCFAEHPLPAKIAVAAPSNSCPSSSSVIAADFWWNVVSSSTGTYTDLLCLCRSSSVLFHGRRQDDVVEFEAGTSKVSKVNSSMDDIDDHGDMDLNRVLSNYNFGEVEALNDEMKEQSDTVLFESLRRLQLVSM